MGLGLGVIDRAYERLVSEGGVGITGSPWSQSTERRALPDCSRGGCHRPATKHWRSWELCEPCYDAIVSEVF